MKDNTKKTLKYYWQTGRQHWLSGLVVIVTAISATAVNIINPLYYKQLFDALAGGQEKETAIAGALAALVFIGIFSFIGWISWRLNSFFMNHFESRVMARLADRCFKYLHKHSFNYFNNNFVGTLVKRVNWFTRAFESIFDQFIFNVMPLIISIGAIVFILGRDHLLMALSMVAWSALFIICNFAFAKFKIKYDIRRNELESAATGLLADTITNNANVKLFNGYLREVRSFVSKNLELAKARKFTWDLGAILDAVQGFLTVILEVAVMYWAIIMWRDGLATIGDLVLIQAYIFLIMERVWSFNKVLRAIYENLSDAEEMTAILSAPHEITDVIGAEDLRVKEGKIEFQKVIFNYSRTRVILKNFSLTVAPRERLAIIGPSGSGKTTIAKALLRMHDLTGGRIFVDGQDIAKVTQESLWANISLVPQDPILFHRTLMENIRYGRSDATDEEVIVAAKAAHCHEFIQTLEKGYDTFVGERGIKLSGGERQRVAIARAILRDAPIMILDEATSSLDSESEGLIQQAIDKLMENKTVIVIAHRLSTIRKMDRIIVLDGGRIIEEGDHDSLAQAEGGIYKKLWELQAGGFVVN